jgi:hypothetical protein
MKLTIAKAAGFLYLVSMMAFGVNLVLPSSLAVRTYKITNDLGDLFAIALVVSVLVDELKSDA